MSDHNQEKSHAVDLLLLSSWKYSPGVKSDKSDIQKSYSSDRSKSPGNIPGWQSAAKTVFDYLFSIIILLILSPFMILISMLIMISGRGSVFYTQDRIGKNGKSFVIYKFRTMISGAENGNPILSSLEDERLTSFGRFMRKYRIDELPNFFNVLRGEMSIVGPRPERRYFIDLIVKKVPDYAILLNIKPGITGWGQVKYGYASTVEKMIERIDYERYYLENRSIWFDLKIIILTLGIIFKGKGI